MVYKAKWTKNPEPEKTHTVTYFDEDGKTVFLGPVTVNETKGESDPEAPTPTRDGYTFNGWDKTTDKDGNITYTAKWTKNEEQAPETPRTVSYVDPGGKTIYMDKTEVKDGKEPDAPSDPKKDGYIFGGWERKSDKDGNVTYTAKWTQITHTVTFVDGRTGTVISKVSDVKDHADVTDIPTPEAHEGYEFKGWNVDGKLVTDLNKLTDITADTVITAVYDAIVKPETPYYTITYIDARTGDILKDESVAEHGSSTVPKAPEYEGYEFAGWRKPDDTVVKELTVEDVMSDAAYVAVYNRVYQEAITGKRIIHYRYIDVNGREVVEDHIDTVRFTRTATVDAITGETTFSEWTPRYHTFPEGDVPVVEGYTPDTDKIPEQTVWPNGENEELWVVYKPVVYEETKAVTRKIVFREYTADGKEISPTVEQTVHLKRTYTLDPDTKERVYSAWEITGRDNELVDVPEIPGYTPDMSKVEDFFVDLNDPKDGEDVVVIYDDAKYTVTFVDGEGNVLKVQEDIGYHGKAEAPEAPTREGYTFAGWDKEFDDVTGDLTVTAKWVKTPETYTVTYMDPDGTVYQTTKLNKGDAEPEQPKEMVKAGFVFGGWIRSVDDKGNVTYTAQWIAEKKDEQEPTDPTEPTIPTDPTEPDKKASPTVVTPDVKRTVVTDPQTGKTTEVVSPTKSVNTGDTNETLIWIILAIAAAGAGVTAVVIGRRRKEQ